MQGTEARMRVSSVMWPRVVLRHVEVGADEDALAGNFALGAQIGETEDVHGLEAGSWKDGCRGKSKESRPPL